MNVRIRDAVASDRAAIVAANRAGQPGVTALSDAVIDDCFARATLFRVAEQAGSVCAYLIALAPGFTDIGDEYAWFSKRGSDFLYVDQVAVAPHAHRRGIGRALYADVEQVARARGLTRITCDVNLRPPNPESLAFHAAAGFREVGRIEVSDGRFAALLEKAL